jgi:hypothetical protein
MLYETDEGRCDRPPETRIALTFINTVFSGFRSAIPKIFFEQVGLHGVGSTPVPQYLLVDPIL